MSRALSLRLEVLLAASLYAAAGLAAPPAAEDLLAIVDIGVSGNPETPLAVSPDGRFLAFEARRSDLAANTIQVRWKVLPLESGAREIIDAGDGGQPQQWIYNGLPVGRILPEIPQWSSDSAWFAYRVERDGEVQLWRSRRDGTHKEQLTHNAADVAEFRWSATGDRLLFKVYAPRAQVRAERQQEALRGYLYDRRYSPAYSREPLPDEPDEVRSRIWAFDVATLSERLATDSEREEFLRPRPTRLARADDLRPDRTVGVDPPLTIRTDNQVCRHPECSGHFHGVWASEDRRQVFLLRYIDPDRAAGFVLYAWRPRSNVLKKLLQTDNLLKGCALAGERLICAHETATHPATIVAIDLKRGTLQTLYDPNPNFSTFDFGDVTELRWVDAGGIPGFGHLVKPIGYKASKKYPLIVVQYHSRGFLRGGQGDEYPIPLFAAHGFAVLSFERPMDRALMAVSRDYDDLETRGWVDAHERRFALRNLEGGIEQLERMGIIDPERIGITGLSDGGETAAFALIHSSIRFAAAAVSWTLYSSISRSVKGPKLQPLYDGWRIPWGLVSISMNAAQVTTPLLIQVADCELLPETDTVAALQTHGQPVEMYVFPDEDHIKWQPAHRYHIYRRNLQWFQFWLQGVEAPEPLDVRQYERWRALRGELPR